MNRRGSGSTRIAFVIRIFARGDVRREVFLSAMLIRDDRTPTTIASSARIAGIARSTGCAWWAAFRATLEDACHQERINPGDILACLEIAA